MGSASARPPDRPERDRSAADPADGAGSPGGPEGRNRPVEDFGPLVLERMEKDDGRALIVYARAGRGRA